MKTLAAAWMITRKDLRLYCRDRTALLLGFLLPVALITVAGFMMSKIFGGPGNMPRITLWVADEDRSRASREFVERLRDVEMINVRPRKDGDARKGKDVRELVRAGNAHHGLIIEAGFGKAIAAGRTPQLSMPRDPGRKMEDRVIRMSVMQAYMAGGRGDLCRAAIGKAMRERGMEEDQVARMTAGFESIQRVFEISAEENEGPSGDDGAAYMDFNGFMERLVPIENEDFKRPGRSRMLTHTLAHSISGTAVMMLMFGLLACSTTLLEEREKGTLPRLLVAAIPAGSVFWGKYLFCAIIGLLQLLVFFIYGNVMFRIDAFRDPVTLLILSASWVAAATSFGMLIAAWSQTTKQAEGLSSLLILVMAALGGCWYPIQMIDLPLSAQIATRSSITYWAVSGYQGMFWDQLQWYRPKMLTAIGIQWAVAAVMSAAALVLYRRRYVAG